ncbi:hypothetical protein E1263_12970 [Kribbella antibiotica]|uniref:Uncharacterized protein n=1 Tax=Kribbella antibiotica TaxID=190195 RepID=A0A4R4ZMH3_9ACTN|nr:hypothetical protein [Kribbella antibiotica]TDD60003.1 hypothetical protein E1263_12970 [Kribbella antibiotica]
MTLSQRDLADVGVLIGCGLRPKLRAGADSDYRGLLDRYRADIEFRNAVNSVLDGLDTRVLSDSDLGLVLGVRRESVFAYRISDLSNVGGVTERLLVGLVSVAIAAFTFPTPGDFDDDRVRRVSVYEVERFLRATCDRLKRSPETASRQEEMFEEAWRTYDRLSPGYKADKGEGKARRSKASSVYWVASVLTWMVDQGLARPASGLASAPETFQLLERFRIQARELAGNATYDVLSAIRRDGGEEGIG